jgi:iron complex transport system substrate-binding protein
VGPPGRVNIESTYALRPDLVLASTDCNARSDVEALRRLGCEVKVFAGCESFSCMCAGFLELGGILDRRPRAEALLKDIKARLAAAQEKLRGRARPRVFWQIGASPLVTASNATFSGEFLARAGAENIFGDAPVPYPRVNAEEVLRRNPDVIIVVSRMEPGAGPSPWKRFGGMEAVKKGRIVELDADLVCQPTPLMFLRASRRWLRPCTPVHREEDRHSPLPRCSAAVHRRRGGLPRGGGAQRIRGGGRPAPPGRHTTAGVVVWELRIPRIIRAVLVGSSLAGCGTVFQAVLRNPLAEPYTLGVSAGGALGATTAIVLGLSGLPMVALCFTGCLASICLVIAMSTFRDFSASTIILSGWS